MAWLIDRDDWLKLYYYIKNRIPGLSFEKDQYATDVLSEILIELRNSITLYSFLDLISHKELVFVVGCGKRVSEEMGVIKGFIKEKNRYLLVAANGATKILLDNNLLPDVVITDLDGDLSSLTNASSNGSILVVHAHGDNVDKLKYVKYFQGPIIGSTQVEPRPFVYNFGGFTDGDRALFTVYHAGYRKAVLVGFDFDDPYTCPGKYLSDSTMKKSKLDIARFLINYLSIKGMIICNLGDYIAGSCI